MVAYLLDERIAFPDPRQTDARGVIAVGGDLSPRRLILAYALGIFPWYEEGIPILWHCPAERAVLFPGGLRVNRTTRKVLRRGRFEVRYDTAFERVIRACARTPRPGQDGTWITPEMIDAYTALHRLGFAHCAESWRDGELAGGIYGVTLGGVFFGESMFSHEANASKVALVTLVRALEELGYSLVDCQVPHPFLEGFGVETIDRNAFLDLLPAALVLEPTRRWPALNRLDARA